MRGLRILPIASFAAVILMGAWGVRAYAQETPASESRGMPPRTGPGEYQSQAKAGMLTVGAEFMGHSVPTPDAIYMTEEYVVVEVGLFGPPEARATLSATDFSLRINGRKAAPSQPFELVAKSLKDPEWEPSSKADKSKGGLSTGGGGNSGDPPPTPPKMPPELRRAMNQRVQRTGMLEGDRALPQAGLLFFEYRGKTENLRSLELIYSGSGGNAVVVLHP